MAQKLDEKDLVSFKELLMANSKMVDAMAQLLIQKGVFTEEEFYAKLKEVDRQYQAGKRTGL
jgi:mannitol/fructose-specific phosphotransferase system IIA component (Ntr-type)